MSDSTESYMNYQTYEYYIISKLNFDRVSDKLVLASVLLEDEREVISRIPGTRKQNISLVRFLFDERREFGPFLAILGSDKCYDNHRELNRTIVARHNSKTEDQIDDEARIVHRTRTKSESHYCERAKLKRYESGSESDSSAFTYETHSFSDINSQSGSEAERESEFEGSEQRTGTPRSDIILPQTLGQGSGSKAIQKKSGTITLFLFLIFLALAIATMPLKIGYKCSKFILVK